MSHRLQILIPESMDERLRLAAARRHLSKSEWARQALERALRRDRIGQDPLTRLASLQAPTADIEEMNAEILAGRSA